MGWEVGAGTGMIGGGYEAGGEDVGMGVVGGRIGTVCLGPGAGIAGVGFTGRP